MPFLYTQQNVFWDSQRLIAALSMHSGIAKNEHTCLPLKKPSDEILRDLPPDRNFCYGMKLLCNPSFFGNAQFGLQNGLLYWITRGGIVKRAETAQKSGLGEYRLRGRHPMTPSY